MEADKIAGQKLGAWRSGGDGVGGGEMGREQGEHKDWEELGGVGWLRWRKGGYGSKEEDILIKGAILGFARDLALEEFPGDQHIL